jgi:HSP20 family molecular chaperone IbpA
MAERPVTQQRSLASQSTTGALTLRFVEPETIYNRMNEVYDAVARRAFELFEDDGRILGRDLDHWFKAESEFLHPAHVQIREVDDAITVEAEVPGFNANELQLSLEPRRLTISGKKQSKTQEKKASIVYSDQCSKELLRSVELPCDVNVSHAAASLSNGVLQLTVPKAAVKNVPVQAKTAGAA